MSTMVSVPSCALYNIYTRVDNIVQQLLQLGPGALMAKLTSKVHIGFFLYILRIGSSWACDGMITLNFMWIGLYRSV